MGTGSFPGVESGRGRDSDPSPLLVPWSKIRVRLYVYYPLGPSWPVKRVKPNYLYTYNVVTSQSVLPTGQIKCSVERAS
jgi:hypothetical protein